MKCHCEESCIKTKKEILENIKNRYKPCNKCPTKTLKKSIPLKRQLKLDKIDKNLNKCAKCGKRHIDMVMAHILKIMIDEKQISNSASIRKTGTPLITPAISLETLPYLSEKSLVIITSNSDKNTAQKIIKEVPEVKAVIQGDINQTVGQINENTKINSYELLTGCDIRCDVQYANEKAILIYKNQSKLHIEYPKVESPKIKELTHILEKYDQPTVLDAMCGPGTLGIYAIQKNAKKVVFNDIYSESIEALKLNLEINEISPEIYEIYNENLLKLQDILENHFDIGIIDAFPNEDTKQYQESLKKICDEVIII